MKGARKRLTLAAGGLLALLFGLLPIYGAFAYVGQNPYVVQMRGPNGPVRCDATAKVTATVTDVGSGNLVPGQAVKWDFKNSPSGGDKVTPKTSVTDNNAESTVTVSFGPVEGQRVVRATIASWPTTIKVSCQGGVAPPSPTPTPTPTRRPTPTPTQTPTTPRTPTPSNTQTSVPSPSSSPATSPSPGEGSPTPSTAPASPGTSGPPASTTPSASPVDSATPDVATPSPEPVATDAPAVPAVPVPTMTPFTPPVVAQGSALGLTTFGLIGLVGLVTGTVTFLLLRKR